MRTTSLKRCVSPNDGGGEGRCCKTCMKVFLFCYFGLVFYPKKVLKIEEKTLALQSH